MRKTSKATKLCYLFGYVLFEKGTWTCGLSLVQVPATLLTQHIPIAVDGGGMVAVDGGMVACASLRKFQKPSTRPPFTGHGTFWRLLKCPTRSNRQPVRGWRTLPSGSTPVEGLLKQLQ